MSDLKTAALDLCSLVKVHDMMSGKPGDGSRRRSKKAKELVRLAHKGKHGQYSGVTFYVKDDPRDGGKSAHLTSTSNNGKAARYAVLKENGWAACSCPDHAGGHLCKHIRALAGAAALWVE